MRPNPVRLGDTRALGFYDRVVTLIWEQTIVDASDPSALGQWWREALGWVVINDDSDAFEIRPAEDRLPGLLFVPVPEQKATKNRLHLDFRPDDRDAEVQRLLALGATRADMEQGEQSWVVLADPEGNEFCVLGSRVS
jgi:predicted enzyme related to lactoylglutathione lyase